YYYDRVTERGFGEISLRCQFSPEELQEKLRLEPAVPFTTAPSGGGMRLFGNFKRGPLAVRLAPRPPHAARGLPPGRHATLLSTPAASPEVPFVSKGRYLPRAAGKALRVRHLNVAQVQIEVREVPPRNLVFWMSNDDSEQADERTSDLIAKRTVAVPGPADQ